MVTLVAAGVALQLVAYWLGFGMSGYLGERLGIAVATAGVLLWLLTGVLRLVEIAGPSEALVLSGRRHVQPDGRVAGYRVIVGGRVLRLPLVEAVERLDLRPMVIEPSLHGVILRGAERASLRCRAIVEIHRDMPYLSNAVERFLGRPREEIAKVAEACLEGAIRGVATALDRADFERDGLKVNDHLRAEAENDLDKLGLAIRSFAVLSVD